MIKTLTLKNFRKHTDAEFNFSQGLVVVRGVNEAGKTTICESVMYALFGSAMLRESLDMVVTYDKPESTLKVDLRWVFDGVDYRVVRGKSGAELTYADQIVTGQRETKVFVERLFGCTADTAKLLMFADQGSIRGVLAKGGTAANGLVETLAQLGLIEQLVDKVQTQLPSGNTKAIEGQIETLKAARVEIPAEPSESEIVEASAKISEILQKIDLTKASTPNDQEVFKGRGALEAKNAATVEISRLQSRKAEISATLAQPVTVPGFTLAGLEQARKDAASISEQTRRWKASQTKFPVPQHEWEGTIESLVAFIIETEVKVSDLPKEISKLEKAVTVAQMKKINDKSCAFCQKDLSDIPEVLQINLQADQAVLAALTELKAKTKELAEQKTTLESLRTVVADSAKMHNLAGEYWELDGSLPPKATWKGEPAVEPGISNLPAMEKEWLAYENAKLRYELLEAELANIVMPELPDVSEAMAVLASAEAAKAALQSLSIEKVKADSSLTNAKTRYESAKSARVSAIVQSESYLNALAQLTATRDNMLKYNDLIKKLRAARPEIASKMWGTVLGAISHYFTQIRGEHSVVTREPAGFKVNGRNIEGLSGSTNDALGLAIRMALSKLFLPNVPFLFLDEAFSACDDNRELAGVSTLASSGFSQVLLVTHSDAPEQLADTLLVL